MLTEPVCHQAMPFAIIKINAVIMAKLAAFLTCAEYSTADIKLYTITANRLSLTVSFLFPPRIFSGG